MLCLFLFIPSKGQPKKGVWTEKVLSIFYNPTNNSFISPAFINYTEAPTSVVDIEIGPGGYLYILLNDNTIQVFRSIKDDYDGENQVLTYIKTMTVPFLNPMLSIVPLQDKKLIVFTNMHGHIYQVINGQAFEM